MGVMIKDGQMLSGEAILAALSDLLPKDTGDPRPGLTFRPQPRQEDLLKAAGLDDWYLRGGALRPAIAEVIGYGGAAYGGKSYGFLGLALVLAYAYPGIQIGYFRRTYKELEGAGSAIHDAYEVFGSAATARDSGKVWSFGDTGSALYFQHCEHENDVFGYQSKQFDVIIFDEATHFTWKQVDYLKTRNRISGGHGLPLPFIVLGSNPGNIGHMWYMQMFNLEKIKKWASGEYNKPITVTNPNGRTVKTWFIPSYIADNKIGVERDPGYEERLRQANPATAQALIDGDWSIFTGQAFRNFTDDNVIKVKDLPPEFRLWPKWRAVDWGYADPFCCLWGARNPSNGRVYVYREVYMAELTNEQQAMMIVSNSPADEGVSITYGDPVTFNVRHTRGSLIYTIADEYRDNGIYIWNADNNRISGKQKIDQLLAPMADGKPGLMVLDTCPNLIRTLPKLSTSEANPEDVAGKQEDHAYDTLRYLLTNTEMQSSVKDPEKSIAKENPWNKIRGM